jgi:hypothetical protein
MVKTGGVSISGPKSLHLSSSRRHVTARAAADIGPAIIPLSSVVTLWESYDARLRGEMHAVAEFKKRVKHPEHVP